MSRDQAKSKAYQKNWRHEHREKMAVYYRRHRFAMEPEAYAALMQAQGCVCAVCRRPESVLLHGSPKGLAVDHDHATGRVRGLLCQRCNLAIGNLDDNPDRARAVAHYLEKKT